MKPTFLAVVMVPLGGSQPLLVYAHGRTKFHAVAAEDRMIKVVALESLSGLVELQLRGAPYPPRKAASFWLNHDHRPVAKRAKMVLRSFTQRKKENA